MSEKNYQVLVIGCWHLGSVVGACIAKAGHRVHLWDQTDAVSLTWRNGTPPIYEPGLKELAAPLWNQNLFWTEDLASVSQTADWVVLAYDTPVDAEDEVHLDIVNEGFNSFLSKGFSSTTNFFLTAQLPVGTSRKLRELVVKANPDWKGNLLYQPENLRLGSAISSLLNPDRVVLGFDTEVPEERARLEKQFRALFNLETVLIDSMRLESAEMVKHALNSFLAACVVFGNELSEICEKTGAHAWEVVKSLRKDSRVGAKSPLLPGLGFAGGTLARDIKLLSRLGKPSGNYFGDLYHRNKERNQWVLSSLKEQLGSLKEKTIVLLGAVYKPDTSTMRRSPAVEIGNLLKENGAHCIAVDPMADLDELSDLERKQLPFTLERKTGKSIEDASAVVLVTEWPEFANLDWGGWAEKIQDPIVIDTKNFLNSVDGMSGWTKIVPGIPEGA